MDVAALVSFGGAAIVFSYVFLLYGILRRPLLEIDASGWSYRPLFSGEWTIEWQNIERVMIYRQRGACGTSAHYLTIRAKDPGRLPHRRMRAFTATIYPSLSGAVTLVSLNFVFLRVTPAKCAALLERIRTTCADELRLYGVEVDSTVRNL